MSMRVLLLNNVPAPYFTPLFERLGDESGWQLTVCYSSVWNQAVGWEPGAMNQSHSHRTVILDRGIHGLRELLGSSAAAAIELLKLLVREKPDYLICYGYTLLPQIVALAWAMTTKTPFAVIGDANYYNDNAEGLKRAVKGIWLRKVTKRAAALITVGTANRMFWEAYGANPARLFHAGFAVDNEFYTKARAEKKEDAGELRDRLGLQNKVVFLFVGRLVQRKNVDLIIRAARQLEDVGISVVIAGSGEEMDSLKALAGEDHRIIFAGNVAPSELPLYYALADVLVLPAEQEPWGLVINEAMACGLAIIAHKHCGAAADLVNEENGVSLRTFSVDELAQAMRLFAGDESLLQAKQTRSSEKIQAWSIDQAARGIIRAIETTSSKR